MGRQLLSDPTYPELGPFAGLAELAAAQRGLLPEVTPGPALVGAVRDAIGVLDLTPVDARVQRRWVDGDLSGEEVSWSVGFGPRTHAYVLRPTAAPGPLPAVVALHCHAGAKWHGKEKIADSPDIGDPEVRDLRAALYGGRAWANALARRGFVVLAHDVFCWGSRRMPLAAMPARVRGWAGDVIAASERRGEPLSTSGRYDVAAALHEATVAKLCGALGTSMAGVVAAEDLAAAEYLRGRADVDADRVAGAGLSGGGCRAALLGALDPGLAATVVVAMMASQQDLLAEGYVDRHTWMFQTPGLARVADWPDVAAARAPAPLLVQYAEHDELFPAGGMRRAHERIAGHYGDTGGYTGQVHAGPHAFTVSMQDAAFAWLADRLH